MQSDQATMVGESIVITGNLTGDEDLIILGRVEGTISLSRTLFVSSNGIAKADIAVENAVISGIVVGNITATDSIQITETGRVRGQVAAGEAQEAESPSASSQNGMSRNISHMYERMGLPARRPMAQPPVGQRGQAQMAREPAQASATASTAPNASSAEHAQGTENPSAPRRSPSSTMSKKKASQAGRRRD
jgi:hypothetical protein